MGREPPRDFSRKIQNPDRVRSPSRLENGSSLKFIVAEITQKIIEVGSLEWVYREIVPVGWENPQTAILLHGLPSQSLTWTGLMPTLAENGIYAIAPDLVGFGNSSKPEVKDFKYTPDAFVQALADFIDVRGFDPDRVNKLVILNAPLTTDVKLPWALKQIALPVAGEMLTQDPLAVERTLEAGCKFVIEDKYLEVYRRPYLKSSIPGRSLLATVRNLRLAESLAEIATGLPKLDIPIQILWGIEDPWLTLAQAETCLKSLKRGELVPLPLAAHYPQEHWYNQINESLVPFLRRQND
jgi:pimeloyl-ACP methyl ester carboxylesterase